MRNLRIVFMGTPEFAVKSLEKILNAGFEVVGVITAPDKPAGRGRKLQESDVKKYAVSQGLTILQPTNLKSPTFLEALKSLNPNVQVIVAFRMLPKEVWQLPKYGTFNLHASLLPQYRGAAPINWAIINGETYTGVSTFFIDEKIDTGAVILQEELEIKMEETVGNLHDALMLKGANLVVETLFKIKDNNVITTNQPLGETIKEAPKLTRENTRINWSAPLQEIFNHIRGLDPYPAAWCYLLNGEEELNVKIYAVEITKEVHNEFPGKLIVDGKTLKAAAIGGFLTISEIQLPGKRKMKTGDLLNGYELKKNAKLL